MPTEIKSTFASDDTLLTGKQILTLGQAAFKRTDNNTEQMNIDGESAGTPTIIWNGTGASDTGGDWTVSGTGSETAGAMHSGTNGWDTGVTSQGDETIWDGGANQDIDGTYDELSFWINPQAYPAGSRTRVFFRNAADTDIGSKLRIDDYTVNMDLGVWQRVTIPISDFGLTGDVDKMVIKYLNSAGQDFWFDDIKINTAGGGGPFRFQVAAPDANTIYHLTMLVLVVAAPGASWDPDRFANISGGLENGLLIRHRRVSDSEILWRLNSRDNIDLFGRFHPQDDITFANGDLLVGFMIKPGLATVKVTNDDVLEWVVRDDLQSLSNLRAYAHYGVETVPA